VTPTLNRVSRDWLSPNRRRELAVIAGVVLLHTGLFALVALDRVPVAPLDPASPPIDVELVEPLRPPPPPPPPPAPTAGGGAPAAASRVHITPKPPVKPLPDPPPAPIVQAPKPEIVVGVAPTAGLTPGLGLGGQGTGTGTGNGSGNGPGTGDRMGPRLVRGPSPRDIARARPPGARGRGVVAVRCRIRLDRALDQCAVVRETPPGQGFGEAAVSRLMSSFNFLPPTEDGAPDHRRPRTLRTLPAR
jgi:protein TonB